MLAVLMIRISLHLSQLILGAKVYSVMNNFYAQKFSKLKKFFFPVTFTTTRDALSVHSSFDRKIH